MKLMHIAVLAVAVLLFNQNAEATPVLGGQIFSTGGDVTVTVLNAEAGYTSELHYYLMMGGTPTFIATNRDVGTTVNLGSFTSGTELIFAIFVRNTGHWFYMGPTARNADGQFHATVDFTGPNTALVGFEDLFGGGDRDYNDNMFRFEGAITPVPTPASLALMMIGGLALVFGRRLRK